MDDRHLRGAAVADSGGQECILEQEDGNKRFVQVVNDLSKAFALCAASDEATEIFGDIAFFQALQAALDKQSTGSRKTPEQMEAAVKERLGLVQNFPSNKFPGEHPSGCGGFGRL